MAIFGDGNETLVDLTVVVLFRLLSSVAHVFCFLSLLFVPVGAYCHLLHLCHQSVLAVARDVGVDDRLSAVDVSMLEDLTGGRRAELLNVLERVKESSSGGMSVWSLTASPRAH